MLARTGSLIIGDLTPTKAPETPNLPQGQDLEEATESTPVESQAQRIKTRRRRRIEGLIRGEVRRELRFFSGPLPPPEILIEYNKVFPECGRAIVEMAQNEQSHRHRIENRHTEGDISLAKRGQIIGAILGVIAVAGAIYLLAHDKSVTGLTVLGTVVAAFGGAFVYDRYQRSQPGEKPNAAEAEDQGRKTQGLAAPPAPDFSESES